MNKNEYVETLVINDKFVPVGFDDYGQCYFFEYIDGSGVVQTISCGTYNSNYVEEIENFFETPEQHNNKLIKSLRYEIWELYERINKLEHKIKRLNKKVNKK